MFSSLFLSLFEKTQTKKKYHELSRSCRYVDNLWRFSKHLANLAEQKMPQKKKKTKASKSIADANEKLLIDSTNNGSVLLTGGAGYVGTHTALQLLEQNLNVVVIDNLVSLSDTKSGKQTIPN